jgi:hypothetical protein
VTISQSAAHSSASVASGRGAMAAMGARVHPSTGSLGNDLAAFAKAIATALA